MMGLMALAIFPLTQIILFKQSKLLREKSMVLQTLRETSILMTLTNIPSYYKDTRARVIPSVFDDFFCFCQNFFVEDKQFSSSQKNQKNQIPCFFA